MDSRVHAVITECNIGYDMTKQEEDDFDIGWKRRQANSTANDTAEWYIYRTAEYLDSYPYWGQLALYSGGGYVVPLRGSKGDLVVLMQQLQNQSWIDRYTRAVFIEFTIYNAQVCFRSCLLPFNSPLLLMLTSL